MKSVVLRQNSFGIEKPWSLVVRQSGPVETDYTEICTVSDDDARLLAEEGISWLFGAPDWKKHYEEIDRRHAERELRRAQARVKELEEKLQK